MTAGAPEARADGEPEEPIDLPLLIMRMSLLTDLARDVPFESALVASFVSLDLADAAGVSAAERRAVFYASMLRYLGCTAYSSELVEVFDAEERSLHARFAQVDGSDRAALAQAIQAAGPRVPLEQVASAVRGGLVVSQCEVAQRSAQRLGLEPLVAQVLGELFEAWDGSGGPRGMRGDQLARATRVMHVGYAAALPLRARGPGGAAELLAAWSGTQLDPALVEVALRRLPELHERCASPSIWEACAEMAPAERRPRAVVDDLAMLLADFADLKSVYRLGHSPAVAELAAAAARQLGLGAKAERDARLAGLVHDVGMVAVSTNVLDRAQGLSLSELERVHSHAYYTRRVLSSVPELEHVASIAGAHHERLDSSGYPAGVGVASLPLLARVVAAADVARALMEARPHRPALTVPFVSKHLQEEVARGRLDAAAVEAVRSVLEQRAPSSSRATLFTPRQVEVLRLLAHGLTEKEIAGELGLSPRTVHHHITAIYERAGVSSRAAVALFAVDNGLLI